MSLSQLFLEATGCNEDISGEPVAGAIRKSLPERRHTRSGMLTVVTSCSVRMRA